MSILLISRIMSNCVVPRRYFGRIINRYGQLETYYDILRVPENSNREQIREAFMQLSKQFHPDVGGHFGQCDPDRTAMFIKISEAYFTLSRPILKKQYDQTLWLRTVAQRNIKSGSYGVIHDFHRFGRNKCAHNFDINCNNYTNLRKPNACVQRQSLPEPTPRIIYQLTNMVATYMSYSGICGAIFSVVNSCCGINHAKLHRALEFPHSGIAKSRMKAFGLLIDTGRKYFINVSTLRKRRDPPTSPTATQTPTAAPRNNKTSDN